MRILIRSLFLFFLICTGSASATEENRVKIAAIFSKTGPAASSNLSHFQAIRHAATLLNQKGGILGKPVEILEIDNGSTPILSRLAAEKAVTHQVHAVLGASWSSHSLAMAPVLQKARIPMISPDSTHVQLTRTGDCIFRVCFTDALQGQVLARFAIQGLAAKNAVIIQNIASDYSLGLAGFFSEAFMAHGGTLLATFDHRTTQKDFSGILRQTAALKPALLFVAGHDESGRILDQAQQMGITATPMGGDGWSTWDFWAMGAQKLKKGYFTTHWSREVDTPEARAYIQSVQGTYPINEIAALAHDAIMLLANAMERAGSLDREKIREALAATQNFRAVTGTLTMDGNGDPRKPVFIMEIREGKAFLHSMESP